MPAIHAKISMDDVIESATSPKVVYPSANSNKDHIWGIIRPLWKERREREGRDALTVLEVSSGTGQQITYFASVDNENDGLVGR